MASRALTVPMPPASAGYAGWFSNGEVHSGVTPALLGIAAEHYAVGSGRALGVRTLADIVEQNLDGQTPPFDPVRPDAAPEDPRLRCQPRRPDRPLPRRQRRLRPGARHRGGVQHRPQRLRELPAVRPRHRRGGGRRPGRRRDCARARRRRGRRGSRRRQIFLYTLPGAAFFPSAASLTPERLALANLVIGAHNAGLAEGAELLRLGGLEAELVDVHRIAEELVADSATFGLLPDWSARRSCSVRRPTRR